MRASFVAVVAALVGCGGSIAVIPEAGPGDSGPNEAGPPPIVVSKVDVLFAIDNSASMGDKQDLLAAAIPTFIDRLVNPHCVASPTKTCLTSTDCTSLGAAAACEAGTCFVPGDSGGVSQCKTIPGTTPEFPPIHDLHVGIVSSSLGGGGSPDICVASMGDPTHQNDQGHLVNRTYDPVANADGPPIANASPLDGNGGNFLAWLPTSFPQNVGAKPPNVMPYSDGQQMQLDMDLQSLVTGVQQHGCGLEAQLESWYHFLVQPDPWESIVLDTSSPPKAQLTGYDTTLLKMRHDFLRPDSAVAIIQITDEEDSWSDPLWLGGYGWVSRTNMVPGGPGQGAAARGTSECDQPVDVNNPTQTGSNNPDCTSCMFPSSNKPVAGTPIGADPNCNACAGGTTSCPEKGWYTPADPSVPIAAADGVNVRYSRQLMRQKYGYDNQHNYHRYVDGLTSPTVPDRNNESHDSSNYAPKRNCTNPLFALSLPDGSDTSSSTLCNLAPGPRPPSLVFYSIIGGVPPDLLIDGGNFKLTLAASDWTAILGQDPDHYIFSGIDPRMVQSTAPRPSLTPPSTTTYTNDFREWNTLTSAAAIDLEYACTFDLPNPKDCTAPQNQGACDCTGTESTAPDGPPLCDTTTRTTQVKGKAYPQSRYQLVAKALGGQAIVSSICAGPAGAPTDLTTGYNAGLLGLVDKMRPALAYGH